MERGDRGRWRERVVGLDGSLRWLMVPERKGARMGVSPESVNRGMEWRGMTWSG